MTIQTHLLIERRDAIAPLAALLEAEWPDWYNARGASARTDLSERMRRDGLPLGIVAYREGELAGTCAITVSSGGLTERSPWLSGLLVSPGLRRHGVATALVERALVEARRLGYERLHALTDGARPLFTHLGWSELDRVTMDGIPHSIFVAATGLPPP